MHRTEKYIKHLVPHVGNRDEKPKLSSVFHLIPFKCMTDGILSSGNDTCTEKTMFLLAKPSVSFNWLAGYDL